MVKSIKISCLWILTFYFIFNSFLYCKNSSNIITANQWIKEKFQKGNIPPFSFIYDGKISDSFILNWDYKYESLKSKYPNVNEYLYTYSDKSSGLTVKCFVTGYNDFNSAEYFIRFINTSTKNTPIIENVNVINNNFEFSAEGKFILYHSIGSNAGKNDFQPFDETMQIGKNIYLTPSRGRSSDETAFPFFNIETPANQGIVAAIGWSGKWFANIVQKDAKSFSLNSGMENVHLTLYPNEDIRTPKICLLFWEGKDRITGHNQFRRFVLTHHTRKINGKMAELPLSGSFDYGDPKPCGEYECLTEDMAIALVKRYNQFNIVPEVFWLDAGWYKGCGIDHENGRWDQNVGNWTVDEERFPNGLKSISNVVHSVGAKFMLWFEPERVRKGTELYNKHLNWLLTKPGSDDYLFNLGDKEARIWLTDYISDFIKKQGIDYYRQDFNFDPLTFWKNNDSPDRVGISEAKHIEGLYAYWDSLLVRFPNLIIDNCASGGRRLDLETISRSSPFWRTDYQYGEPNGYQCHTYGLNFYLPLHGTAIYKTDPYTFRSGLGATAVTNWEITGKNSESIYDIQKRIKEYKKLRPYYYGDYYPLTMAIKHYADDNVWLSYQLNRPEQGDGIVVAFRRDKSNDESIRINLKGLEENSQYEILYEDYGIIVNYSGKELMNGFEIKIPIAPGSLLISYKKIENKN
ncbi:MAG: alpha-galactosidase [Ignavibacteriales bacterium]|nr:alpha-galactosidase [Ignavibacteriales bacterium]